MRWFSLLLICFAFALGVFVAKKIYKPESNAIHDSTVILEKIKDVFKLVFVEAHFNELYTHKEYNWFDISPFRKSAIIRIQANVTAGVNMDSSSIYIDEANKSITLRFDQRPVILYMDHSLDYYDLQQGTFNSFTSTELTTLQDKAREIIRNKAVQSDLLPRAATKRDEMISTINQLVQTFGWKLIVVNSEGNEKLIMKE